MRFSHFWGKLAANLPPRLQTADEARLSVQLVNSLETKLPNLRISFQNKRTVSSFSGLLCLVLGCTEVLSLPICAGDPSSACQGRSSSGLLLPCAACSGSGGSKPSGPAP